MKIGIDARFWNETGVGRYIRNLVQELGNLDTSHTFVLFLREKDFQSVAVPNPNWKKVVAEVPWHSLKEQLVLPKIFEQEQLDLMHFPYFAVPIRYKGPYVVTIHDLILHHFATGEATTLPFPLYRIKHLGYRYIIAKAARNAQKVIAVSQATKKEILDHLPVVSEKVVVTYEGVDRNVEDWKEYAGKKGDFFLHVGNVYPHKNASRLIEGFLQADLPSGFQLQFVGREDFFMKRLKKMVAIEHLEHRVIFKHDITDSELLFLYQTARATVVPSLMEGFGLPVLEAMANGCLVAASDIPSLREVAGDEALYFDPIRTDAIAHVLTTIAREDESVFLQKKIAGKNRAAQFTWEKMAKETLNVYESCLSASSR